LAGQVNAYASDPEGDPLTFSWEIYNATTKFSSYENGPSFFLTWPAQTDITLGLTTFDGNGNVVKTVDRLGKNTNSDTCATSSSSSNSSLSSIFSSYGSSSSRSVSSASSSSISRSSAHNSSSVAAQGNCRYVVQRQWDKGFAASIQVKNNGTHPIKGWDVQWQYTDKSVITDSWNAKLKGRNPYSAKNEKWNAIINPGETVEFGFQGKKPAGAASVPKVTGSVCL
jgi:hypothetical protein